MSTLFGYCKQKLWGFEVLFVADLKPTSSLNVHVMYEAHNHWLPIVEDV